jgi:hypothetical protein
MVAIIVPRRSDGGLRDVWWNFTETWLEDHHPEWEIIIGDSPEGPFNRGAALNAAADIALAKGHEVLVVHDGDNITDPARLEEAVVRAAKTGKAWFPSDCYIYLDEQSSLDFRRQQMREGCHPALGCTGHWWPRPAWFKENINPATVRAEPGYNASVRNRHISGILAVPASAWVKVGGFMPLTGWGREDSIFWLLLEHLTGQPSYLAGTTIHFWHDHAAADTTAEIKRENTKILNEFRVAMKAPSSDRALKRLREKYGFKINITM